MSLKNNNFLAIIPARAGSKRLPNKNILELNNKPLIVYSIEAALKSKYIDKIVVSSDSNKILNISKAFNIKTLQRPDSLATDRSTTVDVINHTLENSESFKYIILLQPTSPLRTTIHIDEAIKLLEEKSADAIVSVCEMEHSPLWSSTLDKNLSMSNFINKQVIGKRSQDLPPYYRINGAIYICKTEVFLREQTLFPQKNIFAYIMSNESSIDIDTQLDFFIAHAILKNF